MNEPVTPPSPDVADASIHTDAGSVGHSSRHETTDVSVKSVALFTAGLAAMLAIVLPLLSWGFWKMEADAKRRDAMEQPVTADQSPPQPRLQIDETADLKALQIKIADKLDSYGWVDRKQGVVRIPIERAMQLLAERDFPATASSKPEPAP